MYTSKAAKNRNEVNVLSIFLCEPNCFVLELNFLPFPLMIINHFTNLKFNIITFITNSVETNYTFIKIVNKVKYQNDIINKFLIFLSK